VEESEKRYQGYKEGKLKGISLKDIKAQKCYKWNNV